MTAVMFESFVYLCIVAVGVSVLVYAVRDAWLGSASERWPVTEGKILRSGIKAERDDEGGKVYKVAVKYEYTVAGKTFTSDRVQFGGLTGSSRRSSVADVVDAYPVGKLVEVRYDPDDPELAVLETGTSGGLFLIAAFAAVFLIWSAVSLIRLLR